MATGFSRRRFGLLTLAVLVIAAMLSVAGPAQAQLPGICQQYPDDPSCQQPDHGGDVGPTGGSDSSPSGLGPSTGGGNPNGTANSSGSLPFTGYPLSPLILLALFLLLAGLVARGIVEARNRASRDKFAA